MQYKGPIHNGIELQPPRAPKKTRKILFIFIVMVIILGAALSAYFLYFKNESESPASPVKETNESTVRLIAVGDNIPHDTINLSAKTASGYDYKPLFDQVKDYFYKSDVRFCNAETAIGGEELGISGYPTFNAPIEFAQDLNATGCNLINIANNHVADKGAIGITKTRNTWETLKLLSLNGANRSTTEQNKVGYFEIKGIRFAFLSFSEISNNSNIPDYALNKFDVALVTNLLSEATQNADFVIVSAHWGTEYSSEFNSEQESWAKTFADNGADLVIGTGPHVLQPVKRIQGQKGETLVWFSIGNFLSSQLELNQLIGGIASMEIAKKDGRTTINKVAFLPTYMHYEWTTTEKANQDLLKRRNLKIYALDKAQGPLSRSLNNTTVDTQTSYVKNILNKYTPVKILNSESF